MVVDGFDKTTLARISPIFVGVNVTLNCCFVGLLNPVVVHVEVESVV